jgi:hypothetical protein
LKCTQEKDRTIEEKDKENARLIAQLAEINRHNRDKQVYFATYKFTGSAKTGKPEFYKTRFIKNN